MTPEQLARFERQKELRARKMPESITTLEEIAEWIAIIAELADDDDDEAAHRWEDCLRAAVLRGIANIAPGDTSRVISAQLAWAVLQTETIGFRRWCS